MTTLLISPDIHWSLTTQKAFTSQGLFCDVSHSGKDAQLKAYNKKYNYFVLDLETQNHTGIEVVKYLRNNCSQGKLFVTASSPEKLEELMLNENQLLKMGVTKLMLRPTPEDIVSGVQSIGRVATWKNSNPTPRAPGPTTDEEIEDAEFARININDLFDDAVAVFDYFIRLGTNRFIKVIHHGEIPDQAQLKKYSDSGAKFLYFRQKDRLTFIKYQNDLAREKNKNSPQEGGKIILSMKSSTDKYLEEIFLSGIQPNLIEEGKAICQNMYDTAIQDVGLKKFINNLELFNPAALSHAFLVSFFSTLICKDLEWVGTKSIQTLALGALFHDIGIMQLPPDLQAMDIELMNKEQKELYQTHPALGAEALKSIPGINSGVIQIILQHHEHVNSSGYPAGISGHNIFPLAKVVALADSFAYFLKQNEMSPIEGLKVFLKNINHVQWYDPALIKNLIKALK